MPTRNSRSVGIASPAASTEAARMTIQGVPRRLCSRPIARGIWRCVASDSAVRDTPSIAEFAAPTSMTTPAAATT